MCYTNEIYIFLINYIATNLSFSRKNFNRDKNLDGTFGYHSDYLSIEVNFAIIVHYILQRDDYTNFSTDLWLLPLSSFP